jgi:hypothetical protein
LVKAEQTAENLLTTLAGISLKAGKAIKKALILIKQLEKASLSLVMARKEKIVIVLKIGYIICRLMIPRVQDKVI